MSLKITAEPMLGKDTQYPVLMVNKNDENDIVLFIDQHHGRCCYFKEWESKEVKDIFMWRHGYDIADYKLYHGTITLKNK